MRPNQPRMPKKTSMASTLGRIASRPMRADSSISDMTAKITSSASETLLIWSKTILELVPVISTRLPVGTTRSPAGSSAAT